MSMPTHKEAIAFVKRAHKALPREHRDYDYFVKFLRNIPVAEGACDNEEKLAILLDTSVKVANQLAFILFREGLLSDELEKEYRALPDVTDVAESLKKVQETRIAKAEEISKQMREAQNEQKNIDLFIQVLAGKSLEEAKKAYDEYVAAGGR